VKLTVADVRRLAVRAQMLDGSARSVMHVASKLGYLQLDPTNAVARSHLLVLWSRLGDYDVDEVTRLAASRRLYEYLAALVPTEDYPLHQATMRRYPDWPGSIWTERVRTWMRENDTLRRAILRELRAHGPLRSRDLQDLSARSWGSLGWGGGRNVNRMLDFLSAQGKVLVAGRQGQERLWDLPDRVLPGAVLGGRALPLREVVRRVAERSLRALGVARGRAIEREYFVGGPYLDMARELARLERAGRIVAVEIDELPGRWFVHVDDMSLLNREIPERTTLLSPFDPLIRNRERTEAVFGFRFRLEIYVPKAKREFGYFVMPVVHGDRIIGRIDPGFDRRSGVLRVNAVYAEPDAPADVGYRVRAAIEDLARWLGARDIAAGRVDRRWVRSLEA
jgi:uncharacterized protein YcaQ